MNQCQLFLLLITLLACVITSECKEVVITPLSTSELNAALLNADDGDVIVISGCCNICDVTVVLSKNVTIRGNDAVINCSGSNTTVMTTAHTFFSTSVQLDSVKIINAKVAIVHESKEVVLKLHSIVLASCGDGVYVRQHAHVDINSCTFTDISGTAISVNDSSFSLENTDISHCTAGVIVSNRSHGMMTNSVVHEMSTENGSGVIIKDHSVVNITNLTISEFVSDTGVCLRVGGDSVLHMQLSKIVGCACWSTIGGGCSLDAFNSSLYIASTQFLDTGGSRPALKVVNSVATEMKYCQISNTSATSLFIQNDGYEVTNISLVGTVLERSLGYAVYLIGNVRVSHGNIRHCRSRCINMMSERSAITVILVNMVISDSDSGCLSVDAYADVYVMSSHLYNCSVDNGGDGTGGCIEVTKHASLTVIDSTMYDCRASYGGAIYTNDHSKVLLLNSTLSNNTAVIDGGCVWVCDECQLTIVNSTLEHSAATAGSGGAVYSMGIVHMRESRCLYNNAGDKGGCMAGLASNSSVTDSLLHGCSAGVGGGAWYDEGGESSVNSTSFTSCFTTGTQHSLGVSSVAGGGIYTRVGVLHMYNVTAADCDSVSGGFIHSFNSLVDVVSTNISQCHADVGGAVHVDGDVMRLFSLFESQINNCWAGTGGALYVGHRGSVVTMTTSSVHNCSATTYGGCIAVTSNGVVRLASSSLNFCASQRSGAFISSESGVVDIVDSRMFHGSADSGGLYIIAKSQLTLSSVVIEHSTASFDGGCVRISDFSDAFIHDTVMSDCVALDGDGGGVNVFDDSTLDLSHSTIKDCHSARSGAAVSAFLNKGAISIRHSILLNNTALVDGTISSRTVGSMTVTNTSVSECHIIDSTSPNGCIYARETALNLIDCIVSNSGIAVEDCVLNSSDTVLDNCTGDVTLSAVNSDIHLNSVTIKNSRSDRAVVVESSEFHMSGSTVQDSECVDGCVSIISGNVSEILDSKFTNCRSMNQGGCLLVSGVSHSVLIEGAVFNGCHSVNDGGAIQLISSHPGLSVIIRRCTFSYNTAGGDGGDVILLDNSTQGSASLAIEYSIFRNSSANHGGSIYIRSSNSIISMNGVTVTGASAAQTGGGIYIQHAHSVNVTNSIFDECTALHGGGIDVGQYTFVNMYGTSVIRCLGDGIYNNGSMYMDSESQICRNFPHQFAGDDYHGAPVVCGYVTHVVGDVDSVVLPGVSMTINGHDMMINSSDYIISVANVPVKIQNVPFSFSAPERDSVERGPLRVISRYGVVSDSFSDYIWLPVDPSRCTVHLVDGDGDIPVVYGLGVNISYHIVIGCKYVPSVICYFDDIAVNATLENNGSLSYSCIAPVYHDDGGHSVKYVSMSLNVSFPFVSHVVPDKRRLVLYPYPTPSTVSPSVAHNMTTEIVLCDIAYYNWALPHCHFHDKNGINNSTAEYTNDNRCLRCTFMSSLECYDRDNVSVGLSLYPGQEHLIGVKIIHICQPVVQSDVKLWPPYVIIKPIMTITVPAAELFKSEYLSCRCNEVFGAAWYAGGGQLECTIPTVPRDVLAMVSISNDNHTWISVTTIEFTTNYMICDAGYERLSEGVACSPCDIGFYKPERSSSKCRSCETNRINSQTGATDCYCVMGYQALENSVECVECLPHESCPANASAPCLDGYTGVRCSDCSDGYYRSQTLCLPCNGTLPWLRLTMLVVVTLVAVTYLFVHAFEQSSSSNTFAAVSIGYSFLQVFALIGSVPAGDQVDDPLFESTFRSLSSVNLDIQVVAYECQMTGSDHYFFSMYLIKLLVLPLTVFWVWVLAGCCLVVNRYRRLTLKTDILYSSVSTSVLLMSLLYLVVTSSVLSYVSCTHLENGPWVLDASPDIECFGTKHLNNLWIFVLGMIVYVIGVPMALYHFIVIQRNRSKANESYSRCYGFLSEKYVKNNYYWELVVLARKALLVVAFLVWSRALAVKLTFTVVVLIGALYYQNWHRPMVNATLNRMESVTLVANAIVLTFALLLSMSSSVEMSDYSRGFVQILFIFFVICCIFVIVWIVVFIAQDQLFKKQCDVSLVDSVSNSEYEQLK